MMDFSKIQKTVNKVFLGSIFWICGYIIGFNIALHFVPDFELGSISGDTITGFLFGLVGITLFEIFLEKKAK